MKLDAHAIYATIYVLCMGIPVILKQWGFIERPWFDVLCLGVLFALCAMLGVVALALCGLAIMKIGGWDGRTRNRRRARATGPGNVSTSSSRPANSRARGTTNVARCVARETRDSH